MSEDLLIYLNKTSPSVIDQITQDNAPYNLTGKTVAFRMRPLDSDTLKVDGVAQVTDATNGWVRYDWQTGDTDTAGKYAAWWSVTIAPGNDQDSPEFEINVDEHAPGIATRLGIIARYVKGLIPASYAALEKDDNFGDEQIQRHIDVVKYRLFATACEPALEVTLYSPLVLDYTSKLAALRIIPAAIDYWNDQAVEEYVTGTHERRIFPERGRRLWEVHARLLREAKEDLPIVSGVIDIKAWADISSLIPGIRGGHTSWLTPDPRWIGRPYGRRRSNLDPWGVPWSST